MCVRQSRASVSSVSCRRTSVAPGDELGRSATCATVDAAAADAFLASSSVDRVAPELPNVARALRGLAVRPPLDEPYRERRRVGRAPPRLLAEPLVRTVAPAPPCREAGPRIRGLPAGTRCRLARDARQETCELADPVRRPPPPSPAVPALPRRPPKAGVRFVCPGDLALQLELVAPSVAIPVAGSRRIRASTSAKRRALWSATPAREELVDGRRVPGVNASAAIGVRRRRRLFRRERRDERGVEELVVRLA